MPCTPYFQQNKFIGRVRDCPCRPQKAQTLQRDLSRDWNSWAPFYQVRRHTPCEDILICTHLLEISTLSEDTAAHLCFRRPTPQQVQGGVVLCEHVKYNMLRCAFTLPFYRISLYSKTPGFPFNPPFLVSLGAILWNCLLMYHDSLPSELLSYQMLIAES